MDPAARRRGDLVYLVMVAEHHRRARRAERRWTAEVLPRLCANAGCGWNGGLDQDWVVAELSKVSARPGDYADESYERWRLLGVPVWAALAAGMTPTPGSRKLVGRRPDLP